MELSVQDAARAFDVPESTILLWVQNEGLPTFCINGRYRFNHVDLLEWSSLHKRSMVSAAARESARGIQFARLSRALTAGGVHRGISGADAASILASAAERLPLPKADRALAAEVLAEREKHGTTAVGDGIAIPHPRSPLVFPIEAPVVALCFLDKPADFAAADGKPVFALFILLTPTVREHLVLLADLAAALHDPRFRAAVARRAPADEILAFMTAAS